MSNVNPYVCDTPGVTLSYVTQGLALLRKLMDEPVEKLEFDLDEASGLVCQIEALQDAVLNAMAQLDEGKYKSEHGKAAI